MAAPLFKWLAPLTVAAVLCGCNQPSQPIGTDTLSVEQPVPWNAVDPPDVCPAQCKNAGVHGVRGDLPAGFVAFNRSDLEGLWVQNINGACIPRRVPNTGYDWPGWVSVSEAGDWVMYLDYRTRQVYFVAPTGARKQLVPTINAEAGYPSVVGLCRRSPLGLEYFYTSSANTIHAAMVAENSGALSIVNDRLLVDLSMAQPSVYLALEQIAVSGDQIVCQMVIRETDRDLKVTAMVTVPQGGLGTATAADIYQWANSPPDPSGTCGYAMSSDGSLISTNTGDFGDSTRFVGCLPAQHKGFLVAPFRRVGEPPMNSHSFALDSGVSANWCPPEYRDGSAPLCNDFYRWSFGNSSDYLVGRISGAESPFWGIWLVQWRTNTWTCVTPREPMVPADYVDVHFGTTVDTAAFVPDTADTSSPPPVAVDLTDPCYQVVYPNGGETFRVGDTCSIKVRSLRDGNAVLMIVIGEYSFGLLPYSFNPRRDSVFNVQIPDTFYYGAVTRTPVSPVGQECYVLIVDYAGTYCDYSDGPFTVVADSLPRETTGSATAPHNDRASLRLQRKN